ncbi:MAG: (2Fe-2S) ferredoxin domain-containing protein [Acetivibrionales bacterium]|jgi:NADP-reducing hydrogenase subunit HndB|nr:(2Fe-2S) ferredoxin domain-containing protein [Bacillota bacterium]NLP07244.1 (2Fe-2S) ferredoxin domain-containing protein [Clostridiaceae bacterium]HOA54134.1 (2Fe-2S) ferredoxin domain-containing protein [Clostridiales bacterium]HPZ05818.1 (2Fe-2S) ferredoxin domain-containing protein [Clostridiales bacterium]HQD30140.1 (2Fe-2S) ferredoxin domain-containing protein [Clostridiales bacterium]
MKSLAELEQIRQRTLDQIKMRTNKDGIRIVVGMATCGIAAGARPVMNKLVEEIGKRKLGDVSVSMTGCIGVCKLEPIVEVINADGTKVTYVKMTPEKASRVIAEHIVNGRVCQDLTITAAEEAEK